MSTLHLAIAFASLFAALAIPAIIAAFWFGSRMERLRVKVDAFQQYLSAVGQATGMLAAVVEDQSIRVEVVKTLAAQIQPPVAPNNPFSSDEAARYNRYIQMSQNGEQFTPDQVRDFSQLVQRYKTDHPDDPAVAGLLLLIAFLVGLYLLGRNR